MENTIIASTLKEGDKIEVWLEDEVLPAGGWWNACTVKVYKSELCIWEDVFDYGDFSACEPMNLESYSNDKIRYNEKYTVKKAL